LAVGDNFVVNTKEWNSEGQDFWIVIAPSHFIG
jgi:hypothetical protein